MSIDSGVYGVGTILFPIGVSCHVKPGVWVTSPTHAFSVWLYIRFPILSVLFRIIDMGNSTELGDSPSAEFDEFTPFDYVANAPGTEFNVLVLLLFGDRFLWFHAVNLAYKCIPVNTVIYSEQS